LEGGGGERKGGPRNNPMGPWNAPRGLNQKSRRPGIGRGKKKKGSQKDELKETLPPRGGGGGQVRGNGGKAPTGQPDRIVLC